MENIAPQVTAEDRELDFRLVLDEVEVTNSAYDDPWGNEVSPRLSEVSPRLDEVSSRLLS